MGHEKGLRMAGARQRARVDHVLDHVDALLTLLQTEGIEGEVTLDIDTNGALFNEIVLTPLSNGSFDDIRDNSDFVLVNFETCCPTDKFIEEFDYTLRDVDGGLAEGW